MICRICEKDKDVEDFRWRNKATGKRYTLCKECHKEQDKEFYLKNPNRSKKLRKRKKERFKSKKKWYNEYRNKLKCSRCGYDKCIYALEFHHTNPADKEYAVSNLVKRDYSIERILKEMDKCEILCANCHRETHFSEFV